MSEQLDLLPPAFRLRIVRDEDPQDPREWDNLGTMVCWHRRYDLGDEQPSEYPGEYQDELPPHVALPLYLYDHGGITMRTTNFSCGWDSGQVGFIYVTIAKIKAEYGWEVLTAKRRAKIEQYLRNEVETYDHYLTGNVYGFELEKQVAGEWEPDESCWGFFGDDVDGVLCYVSKEFTKEQVRSAFADVDEWVYSTLGGLTYQPNTL
jgi:hypothetical protein